MRFLLGLLLVFSAAAVKGQSTQAGLEARLLHKPLYLRGLWHGDKLSFDAAGRLRGASSPTSFTLSGIEIFKVTLKPTWLRLEGRRVGLQFIKDIPQRVPLKIRKGLLSGNADEPIRIEIEKPQAGDFTLPLDSIFTESLADLMPSMPEEWQPYARKYFVLKLPGAEDIQSSTGPAEPGSHLVPASPGAVRSKEEVIAPVVLKVSEPKYSRAARDSQLTGNVLVGLEIDQQGNPTHVHILQPLGFGLDETAFEAAKGYKFKPATLKGEPVVVEMNVDVNFRIF